MNEMITKVKRLYEALIPNEEWNEVGAELGYPKLDEDLENYIVLYIMEIICADGEIAQEEIDFINAVLNKNFTKSSIESIVSKVNKFKIKKYGNKGPEWFFDHMPCYLELIIKLDLIKGTCFSRKFALHLKRIGIYTIICDNDKNEQEVSFVTSYYMRLIQKLDEMGVAQFSKTENKALMIDFILDTWLSLDINNETREKEEPKEGEAIELIGAKDSHIDSLQELNDLVGLDAVKKDVNNIVNFIRIRELRKEKGLPLTDMSFHLVFIGNAGTGKTTVARLIAKIYHSLGLISKGHLVEVDRSGLVAGYVGQTSLKVQEVINKAIGGVLFIDEAYSLVSNRGDWDFGKEAIEILLKSMEDCRSDLIVIVAGYPKLMTEFIESNPGLRSRFNKFIVFDDYSPEELLQIFRYICLKASYQITAQAEEYALSVFEENFNSKDFANARGVRNFFEHAVYNQANRLVCLGNPTQEDLLTITVDDLKSVTFSTIN